MPESSAKARISETAEDSDVPPTVSCARCGRQDCACCIAVTRRPPAVVRLVWEGDVGHWLSRLWLTALASSTEPQKTFGELPEGRVLPALAFALLAEALALGSLGLSVVLTALAVAPDFSLSVLHTPAFVAAGFALLSAFALLMVVLHVLWGLCIELGAHGTGGHPRFAQGLRFGLYACGWDLVTSPAGIVGGLFSRGPRGALQPVVQAMRVPRAALRAYVEDCRKFGPEAQRRGLRLSVAVLGGLSASLVLGAVFALYRFAQSLGL